MTKRRHCLILGRSTIQCWQLAPAISYAGYTWLVSAIRHHLDLALPRSARQRRIFICTTCRAKKRTQTQSTATRPSSHLPPLGATRHGDPRESAAAYYRPQSQWVGFPSMILVARDRFNQSLARLDLIGSRVPVPPHGPHLWLPCRAPNHSAPSPSHHHIPAMSACPFDACGLPSTAHDRR